MLPIFEGLHRVQHFCAFSKEMKGEVPFAQIVTCPKHEADPARISGTKLTDFLEEEAFTAAFHIKFQHEEDVFEIRLTDEFPFELELMIDRVARIQLDRC